MKRALLRTRHRIRLPLAFASAGLLAALAVGPVMADHGGAHVTLEPDTRGCNGVLPSNDGNTDMRLAGGTLQPGGTAIFEITYPVNAASVGKEFVISDCAFIDGVAALRYTVEFVPSNQNYVLFMALAVPSDAPVGGLYCNYAKTTGSPTASQGSQRKAGPSCFTIRAPATAAPPAAPAPNAPQAPAPSGGGTAGAPPPAAGTPPGRTPVRLPDTATPQPDPRLVEIAAAGLTCVAVLSLGANRVAASTATARRRR